MSVPVARIGYLDTTQVAAALGVTDVSGRTVGDTGDPTSIVDVGSGNATYVQRDTTAIWGAATGTADRTAYAAYVSPTISNPPTQAEVQGVSDALQALSQHVVGLINDLRASGTLSS